VLCRSTQSEQARNVLVARSRIAAAHLRVTLSMLSICQLAKSYPGISTQKCPSSNTQRIATHDYCALTIQIQKQWWLGSWTQAQKGPVSNRSRDAVW